MHVIHTPESAANVETQFFVGEVRVQPLISGDTGVEMGLVRFSPGARTFLHTHHMTQVLYCVEGRGILATRHEQHLVEPGDVVYVQAEEEHWHGAVADSHFVHLSVRPPGETTWTRVDPFA